MRVNLRSNLSALCFVLPIALVVQLLSTGCQALSAASSHSSPYQGNPAGQHVVHTGAVTILDVLGERPEFSKLLKLVEEDKELTKLLGDPGTISTMFAPINEAFDTVSDIEYPTRDLLMYHITTEPYPLVRLRHEHIIKSLYESPGLHNSPQLLRISLGRPDVPSSPLRFPPFGVASNPWVRGLDEDYDEDNSKGPEDPDAPGLYVNHAKVIIPDLVTRTGAIVHGVNRIVRPPGEHITDEISRRAINFGFLTRAWKATEIESRLKEGKSLTLFAPDDMAWTALPKKLRKHLFSNLGREHLKILTLYHVADRPIYTPEIFNKTDEGAYKEFTLQSLLNSPQYQIHVQAKALKNPPLHVADWRDWVEEEAEEDPTLWILPAPGGHHYPHKDPNHKHHHRHRNGRHHTHKNHKHHSDVPHHVNEQSNKPRSPHHSPPHRDEILINQYARVQEGYEDWIAGNGVIHVIDKVLMAAKENGCKDMSPKECAAWQWIWYLADTDSSVEPQEEESQKVGGDDDEINLFGQMNEEGFIQFDDQEN